MSISNLQPKENVHINHNPLKEGISKVTTGPETDKPTVSKMEPVQENKKPDKNVITENQDGSVKVKNEQPSFEAEV